MACQHGNPVYKCPDCATAINAALGAEPRKWLKQLCEIAAVEMDWLQRLTSSDDAMKQISAILSGKPR